MTEKRDISQWHKIFRWHPAIHCIIHGATCNRKWAKRGTLVSCTCTSTAFYGTCPMIVMLCCVRCSVLSLRLLWYRTSAYDTVRYIFYENEWNECLNTSETFISTKMMICLGCAMRRRTTWDTQYTHIIYKHKMTWHCTIKLQWWPLGYKLRANRNHISHAVYKAFCYWTLVGHVRCPHAHTAHSTRPNREYCSVFSVWLHESNIRSNGVHLLLLTLCMNLYVFDFNWTMWHNQQQW